tara:strand:+ start:17075 stop:17518 length:444 start_codon:yes stop_codon:yes gene_type:complete
MNKETCFICLNEKDKSKYLPLITLTKSKNCNCKSRVHVKCYKKYNKYQKNKCPMCNSLITSKKEQEDRQQQQQLENEYENEYEEPYHHHHRYLQRQNFFGIFYINHPYQHTYSTGLVMVILCADIFMGMTFIFGLFISLKILHIFIE